MGFGSVILGGVADKAGRKPAMLGCLVIMADRHVHGPCRAGGRTPLTIWRFITGLGIGGDAGGDQRGDRRDLDQQVSGRSLAMALLRDRLPGRRG